MQQIYSAPNVSMNGPRVIKKFNSDALLLV
jgi:hypothetical protein